MASKGRIYPRSSLRKSSPSTLIFPLLITGSIFLLIILSVVILRIPNDSPDPPKAREVNSIIHHTVERKLVDDRADQWVEVISWEPRAVIYHNFLSQDECEHLINLAKPHMVKSAVIDNETGQSRDSRVRTSSGTFLSRGFDEKIRTIEKRIADFTFLPVGEPNEIEDDAESVVPSDQWFRRSSSEGHLISGSQGHLISGSEGHLISGSEGHLISGSEGYLISGSKRRRQRKRRGRRLQSAAEDTADSGMLENDGGGNAGEGFDRRSREGDRQRSSIVGGEGCGFWNVVGWL
ncbi:hypothetical protein E3N88_04980 [Mikania micrantha]|uniref:Prolyl 4-hydroxylase alpha subunit domain-containing protein n=1 Tax=Mikania micrantha TaxID=192012 RepID=A0A5N6PWG5_9ASTR|nr:hypothetical protein E3N88_04980 [Mikania micrantha]